MPEKLAQDTFQLPAVDKNRVNQVAATLHYTRGGEPSRSAVYREMVRFTLDNFAAFLKWRERTARHGTFKIKGLHRPAAE